MRGVTLDAIIQSLESGARPKGGASADSGEIASVGGEHLDDDGGFDFRSVKRIPKAFFCRLRSGRIATGDILIVKDGATTGKVSLVRENFPFDEAAVNEHVFRVQIDQERAVPEYIFHFLRSHHGQKLIRLDFRGATVGGISRDFASKIRLELPELREQRRIAKILDKTDALRAKRRATLAELDTLTQSIFLDMFGEPSMDEWPTPTVASIAQASPASIRTGPFGSQLLHSEFTDRGIAVLGIDNVVGNEFRWAKERYISEAKYAQLRRYTVRPGDVLISIMGTCGRCAVVPDDVPVAINTKHLCCITLDRSKCLPSFLHAYFLIHPMARKYLVRAAKGAIMSGLNMGIIAEMPVALAPLSLQHQFERRQRSIFELRAKQLASLNKLDALFASLQHRAFRSEL